jgi:DNA topoisomerase VI subunit B
VSQVLERRTFSVSRAADFLELRALETQTGQLREWFATVVVKELIDNALDACETAGVSPQVDVIRETSGRQAVEERGASISRTWSNGDAVVSAAGSTGTSAGGV